jgi:hypothetical protein
MNSRHVYIVNHYSFPTPSSKYRASAVGGFFYVFYEILPKYREGNQYRVTATSVLTYIQLTSSSVLVSFSQFLLTM